MCRNKDYCVDKSMLFFLASITKGAGGCYVQNDKNMEIQS
jgi:hypothetical protein